MRTDSIYIVCVYQAGHVAVFVLKKGGCGSLSCLPSVSCWIKAVHALLNSAFCARSRSYHSTRICAERNWTETDFAPSEEQYLLFMSHNVLLFGRARQ